MFRTPVLRSCVPERWRRRLRQAEVSFSLTHIHGPRAIRNAPNEAIVTCLVKNGDFYLDQFVDHYLRLGFKHICFLDNGSSDKTVERAIAHQKVSVYRSTLPVHGRQGLLKQQLVRKVVGTGWCLDVDIDELFDYPYSNILSLPQFLEYLNAKDYTAVIAQMLDMFSDKPLSSLTQRCDENLKDVHRYYDISAVTRVEYRKDRLTLAHGDRNHVSSGDTAVFWGGIRRTLYGIKCLLTKHSLFRADAPLKLFTHVHYVNGARLADVSAALLHYKFASNANDEAAQNRDAYKANSDGYCRIMDTIKQRPDYFVKGDTAREFAGAAALLDDRFLFASDDYRLVANRCNLRQPNR